jgi:hypothetical protein
MYPVNLNTSVSGERWEYETETCICIEVWVELVLIRDQLISLLSQFSSSQFNSSQISSNQSWTQAEPQTRIFFYTALNILS